MANKILHNGAIRVTLSVIYLNRTLPILPTASSLILASSLYLICCVAISNLYTVLSISRCLFLADAFFFLNIHDVLLQFNLVL